MQDACAWLGDCDAVWDTKLQALCLGRLKHRLIPFDARLERLGLIVDLPVQLGKDVSADALLRISPGIFAVTGCALGADAEGHVTLMTSLPGALLNAIDISDAVRAVHLAAEIALADWLGVVAVA